LAAAVWRESLTRIDISIHCAQNAGKGKRIFFAMLRRLSMKWTGMYLLGYIIFILGVLAALWKLKVLASIGTVWTLIGVVIMIGLGIMIAVSYSGSKKNIEIDHK
jgi:hypothetical protein